MHRVSSDYITMAAEVGVCRICTWVPGASIPNMTPTYKLAGNAWRTLSEASAKLPLMVILSNRILSLPDIDKSLLYHKHHII